jgi:hypothetical protein
MRFKFNKVSPIDSEFTPSTDIDHITDVVYERLLDVQVYLDYDFIRDMLIFCISSASVLAGIRGELFGNIDMAFATTNPILKPILGEAVTLAMAIPLIVTILGLQYSSKRKEGVNLAELTKRLRDGQINDKDKLLIKACYRKIKSKSRKLNQQDLERVLLYISER